MARELPAPARRKFTVRSLMAAVSLAALATGWCVGLSRATSLTRAATTRIYALAAQVERDDPTFQMIDITGSGHFHLLGADSTQRCRFRTASGGEVAIAIEVRAGIFGRGAGEVTFASKGRSATWPFEDLERGRKVDLRAMFPEAFR